MESVFFLSVSCVNKMHVFHRHLFAMLLLENIDSCTRFGKHTAGFMGAASNTCTGDDRGRVEVVVHTLVTRCMQRSAIWHVYAYAVGTMKADCIWPI